MRKNRITSYVIDGIPFLGIWCYCVICFDGHVRFKIIAFLNTKQKSSFFKDGLVFVFLLYFFRFTIVSWKRAWTCKFAVVFRDSNLEYKSPRTRIVIFFAIFCFFSLFWTVEDYFATWLLKNDHVRGQSSKLRKSSNFEYC